MSAIHTLGWTLMHSLWQGTLAAAGLAALLTVVPARAARSRYALSVATLLVMLALPLATGLRTGSEPSWTDAGAHAFTTRMRAVEPALPWWWPCGWAAYCSCRPTRRGVGWRRSGC